MTYKTKRSLAQLGKHARNMPKLQHPDEAPTPSKQRCSHGYPVRRPPTRRRPRRTPPSAPPARPPSARPCAPSRPSSSWPTCTRCPWKTPTSTQRLPCSPPSLPPGCSMPDGLLEPPSIPYGIVPTIVASGTLRLKPYLVVGGSCVQVCMIATGSVSPKLCVSLP